MIFFGIPKTKILIIARFFSGLLLDKKHVFFYPCLPRSIVTTFLQCEHLIFTVVLACHTRSRTRFLQTGHFIVSSTTDPPFIRFSKLNPPPPFLFNMLISLLAYIRVKKYTLPLYNSYSNSDRRIFAACNETSKQIANSIAKKPRYSAAL